MVQGAYTRALRKQQHCFVHRTSLRKAWRKSCPQLLMQWASSTAKNDSRFCLYMTASAGASLMKCHVMPLAKKLHVRTPHWTVTRAW